MKIYTLTDCRRICTRLTVAVALICAAAWLVPSARAQGYTTPERGFQKWASYQLADIETIDVETKQLMYNIPIASLPPGPAGMSFDLYLHYNSNYFDYNTDWEMVETGDEEHVPHMFQELVLNDDKGGWSYGLTYDYEDTDRGLNNLGACEAFRWRPTITFPDGSEHLLFPANDDDHLGDFSRINPFNAQRYKCDNDGNSVAYGDPLTLPLKYYSGDGSYLQFLYWSDDHWVLYLPDGSSVEQATAAQYRYDRNGNKITVATYDQPTLYTLVTDSAGRTITIEYEAETETDKITTSNGSDGVEVKVKIGSISVGNRNYQGGELVPTGVQQNLNVGMYLVEEIQLPGTDGAADPNLKYGFEYREDAGAPCDWLQVAKLTLPSGAYVDYSTSGPTGCGNMQGPEVDHLLQTYLDTKSLTITGQPPLLWDYGWNYIDAPDGGQTIETGCGVGYSRTETPDKRIDREWGWDSTFWNGSQGQMLNRYPTKEFITLKDASGGYQSAKTRKVEYKYDKNGNIRDIWEYDWVDYNPLATVTRGTCANFVTGIGGTELTHTANTYYQQSADADADDRSDQYAYYNLLNGLDGTAPALPLRMPLRSMVEDGNNVTASDVSYFYYQNMSWNQPDSNWNLSSTVSKVDAGTSITQSYHYDGRGNQTQIMDGRDIVTEIEYDDCGTNSIPTYPKLIKRAEGSDEYQETTLDYSCDTGLLGSSTLTEGTAVQAKYYYDGVGRLIYLSEGNGALNTRFDYDLQERSITTASPCPTPSENPELPLPSCGGANGAVVAKEYFDELWRPSETLNENTGVRTLTKYKTEPGANFTLESNPFTGTSPSGWTRTKHDTANRVEEVRTFAGAEVPAPIGSNQSSTGAVTTAYAADSYTVTDQQGKQHIYTSDGIGRLTEVEEDPNVLGYITTYEYDAAGNLTQVDQGGQIRTFEYDWLGRLKSADNPETGIVSYGYDENGNLTSRTDAANRVTSMAYDNVDRVYLKSYADGTPGTPSVTYCYDGKVPDALDGECKAGTGGGFPARQLTGVRGGTSETSYTYDALGRPTSSTQTTDGEPYPFFYQWTADGQLKQITYPSSKIVSYCFDDGQRLKAVRPGVYDEAACGDTESTFYASEGTYAPHGALAELKLGNGLWEKTQYNSRLQPLDLKLGTEADEDQHWWLHNDYGTSNNGNIMGQTLTLPQTAGGTLTLTQGYEYDGVNRLTEAREPPDGTAVWSRGFTYTGDSTDGRYGNLTISGTDVDTGLNCGIYSSATNRCTAANFHHDAAGNLDSYGSWTLAYDAENRQKSLTASGGTPVFTYHYDGEGRRVKKVTNLGTTIYVYDALGQLAAEYQDYPEQNQPDCATATCYLTSDHLGSTRVVTDQSGEVASRYDYFPFGGEIPAGYGNRASVDGYSGDWFNPKFTAKLRDYESGLNLDYFGARYFAGTMGRFTTPDAPLLDQVPEDPQSWNLYGYARNNPLLFFDPTGNYVCASSMTAEQCTAIEQARLDAQAAADKLKESEGSKSRKYTDAQRAIDALGEQGIDNGVTVTIASIGHPGAQVEVGGNLSQSTADNPNGQNMLMTIDTTTAQGGGALLAITVAHEGSHIADGSAWISSGFAASANPTMFDTEFRAHQVSFDLYGAMGGAPQNIRGVFITPGYPDSMSDPQIEKLLARPPYSVSRVQPGGPSFSRGSIVRRR